MQTFTIGKNEVQVWCFELCEAPLIIERAYSILSEDERLRALRFRYPSLTAAFILSRAILRALLASFSDCVPSALRFAYGLQGKPFLADGSPIRFNMSHSGQIAAYAITLGREVGVDIEQHRHLSYMEQIAFRFFSSSEYRKLLSLGRPDREIAFFKCWVRKEAYIKTLGRGLAVPLDSFQVSLLPDEPSGLLGVQNNKIESHEWQIEGFSPSVGYSGAVAVRSRDCSIRVHSPHRAAEVFSYFHGDFTA
jgi:4'-phosphopantetheinyl transferase